jgi:hypothetical protein
MARDHEHHGGLLQLDGLGHVVLSAAIQTRPILAAVGIGGEDQAARSTPLLSVRLRGANRLPIVGFAPVLPEPLPLLAW